MDNKSLIQEIRDITAVEVAKRTADAKTNFPKIVEQIRGYAGKGLSECMVPTTQMNEYDKNLLTAEGFTISLVDTAKEVYSQYAALTSFKPAQDKIWKIKW